MVLLTLRLRYAARIEAIAMTGPVALSCAVLAVLAASGVSAQQVQPEPSANVSPNHHTLAPV
jgi:hypothetical protein